MKVNRILMLILFFIFATVLIGMCQQQADAAEFILDGYRIDAQLQSYRNSFIKQHGYLDLIQLNSSGELELMYGIQELSVTDQNGVKVPWEEAKSILSQALMRDLRKDDSPPWSLTDWILPVTEFIPVRTDSGHIFEVVATGGFSEVGHRAGIVNTIKTHNSRVELYKTAILRVIAMEQTRYFFEEVLNDDVYTKALDLGVNAAKLGLKVADFTDEIATRYVQLRVQSGATQAMASGASAKVVKLIGSKVVARFGKTFTGKIARGTRVFRGANKILGPIGAGLEVVANIQDQTERDRMLFQLRNDLVVLQGLNDMLALMEAHGELVTDPAMIEGIEAALHELADLSSWRWGSVGKGVLKASPTVLSYLGTLTLTKLGVAGPWGFVAGLAIYQTGEAFKAWDEWEQSILTLSAYANLGNYLHRRTSDSRIWQLTRGHFVKEREPGFPVRELVSFRARLAAEGSAWFYNIIWAKRWSSWVNAANIGDSLGKAIPELIFKIFTGQDPQEHWKTLVTERGAAFRYTQEVYTRMPIFLDQLKQVYVPRPSTESTIHAESTSLADIALIIDSSGSMGGSGGSDPNNLRISGAKLFIESADPKVQIAIVDFDSSARTLAPLTFANFTGKDALKRAVEGVDASGGTDIDDGLQQGFQELNTSTSAAKKAAVLLTDGQDPVAQHVISNYTSRGWPIYTIGLGSSVERRELERIAQETGGEYFEASHDYHIQTVYSIILAKTTGKSTLARYAGYINKGQQITKNVSIDDTVDQVDISCNWQGSTIELVLIDPNGTRITPQGAAADPRITYKPAATYAIYTLENPKPGKWQLQATGTDIPPQGEPFNLTVNATSDFSTNFLSFDSSYTVGETIQIGIEVQEKTGDTFAAVLGATTAAKVVRPDGRIDTLTLYDDGSHDDRVANDGIYANNYRSVDKQGTYLIQVSAENGFSREIQAQVVVGRIDNILIDGSTLTPAAGTTLKQAPSVIRAVISGPAGRINATSIVLKVDGRTVSHTYNRVNQLVSYRPGGLSGGSHNVQLSVRDVSGNTIETTWTFTTQVEDAAQNKIYWTDYSTDKIQRANLDGTGIEDLVTGLESPQVLALDLSGGKMYWADDVTYKIQRANLDGTGIEDLVTTGLDRPHGIALDLSGGKMYWTDAGTDKIQRANLDGTGIEDLVTTGLSYPYGLALDLSGGKMYWIDRGTYKIQRANLNGTNIEDLVTTGLKSPHGIALDVSGGKMYWADEGTDKIQRANLNGTNIEDLVTTGVLFPLGLALDVSNGKMYWTDVHTNKIQRANLNGTNIEDLVTTGLESPLGIALDVSGGPTPPKDLTPTTTTQSYIYWTDRLTDKIQRANLDGTNIEDLVTGLSDPEGIALDMSNGKMYWTDWSTDKIQRANLDGTNIEDLVTTGLSAPIDIALDVSGGKMYWTDVGTDKIQRANLDGSRVEDLVTTGLRGLRGIALDVSGGKMYWADNETDKIQRANLDGTNVEDLVTRLPNPEGIALDMSNGKMYWIDWARGKIQRANLDGSRVEDLVTGIRGSEYIALDVTGGKMYWTSEGTDRIQRANLDGTNVEDLVTRLGHPQGIALSITSQTPSVAQENVNGRVLFFDDFSSGNLNKWTPRARIGTVENGALKLVGIQGGNYSVDVVKDIFPTENYAKYVLSFDWKSTVKETPYGISHVSAYFYNRTGELIGQMLALNTGFPNRTFEDHGGDLVPGRYGGVFKVHETFDWERVTLDTSKDIPGLNMADVHRIHLRAEVYNDAGRGGDLYVDNLSFIGVSGTLQAAREDVNGDGVVDLQDTTVVRANLGQRGQNDADVNGDGIVDVEDLVLVLAAIEDGAGAPALYTQALTLFTAEELQQWFIEARGLADKSPAHRRGILMLEQLLALLTPKETTLLANYPNPFNPETWLPYRLAAPAEVTLTIYAVNGQVVRTLALGHQAAGFYETRSRAAYWDGRNAQGESVASGVYFYTLSAGDFTATRKLLIRK